MTSEKSSFASLTISFGLVAIPVSLYSSTIASEKIAFHLLRKKDRSRLKQQYIAASDGEIVERSEMIKGYEWSKDRYVTFTPKELKELEEAGSPAIEISVFVPLTSIDPVYFDNTYYLAPDRGGAKPYTLLTAALRDTGRCAIGKWAARGREHVVAIRPLGDALALHQLHFQSELRTVKDLGIEPGRVTAAELKLARQLIEQQASTAFDPDAYVDEFKGRVDAAIKGKIAGQDISFSEAPKNAPGSNVIDLMAALRASIGTRKSAARPRERSPSRRRARARSSRSAR